MSTLKEATIEEVVLEMLIKKGDAGVTVGDFPEHLELDEKRLAEIIDRIEQGL